MTDSAYCPACDRTVHGSDLYFCPTCSGPTIIGTLGDQADRAKETAEHARITSKQARARAKEMRRYSKEQAARASELKDITTELVADRLAASPKERQVYESLPDEDRRSYIDWISESADDHQRDLRIELVVRSMRSPR